MNFEYGVQTNNRYNFFIDQEDTDPSELMAKVSVAATTEKSTSKDGKTASSKGNKSASGKSKPLSENATKNKSDESAKGKDARQNKTQGPKEDKENKNRESGGRKSGADFREKRDNDGTNQRPPRRTQQGGGGGGGFRPRFQDGITVDDHHQQQQNPNRDNPVGGDAQGGFGQQGGFGRRGGGRGGGRGGAGGAGGSGGGFRGGFATRRRMDNERQDRDFDRHSGSDRTGVKAVDKRHGAGMNNWGTVEDEQAAISDQVKELDEENTTGEQAPDWANQVDEDEKAKDTEESKEVVPKFMTLDEWKALKNEVNKKNEFNIRQAGEGEDSGRWKEFVMKQREEDDEEEEEEEEEEDEEEEEEEDEKQKLVNQIKIQFYEPSGSSRGGGGGRGGRGGRGGSYSGGGGAGERHEKRQEDRSERSERPQGERPQRRGERPPRGGGPRGDKKAVPKIEDEKDFPSLGKQ